MSEQKLNLLLLFGGPSPEHEVSVVTGFQVLKHLNKDKYNIIGVYVDKQGRWWHHLDLNEPAKAKAVLKQFKKLQQCYIWKKNGVIVLRKWKQTISERFAVFDVFFTSNPRSSLIIDVVLPAFHGGIGESGAMQGLFESIGIPYAGSGVLGSALGMDKVIMKDIFRANGIPVVPSLWFHRVEWERDGDGLFKRMQKELGDTVIVKPATLGSSIAVAKITLPKEGGHDFHQLQSAVELALAFDDRVVVEKAIVNLQEVNCAVLGDTVSARASACEEPLTQDEILSFQEKYLKGGKKTKGMAGMGRKIPAPITSEETARIQELALKVFKLLNLSGVARIDFLIDRSDNTIYVNEPNTIPGSFSFYLWEASGLTFSELLDELVAISLRQHERKQKLISSYDTPLLDQFLAS